MCIRVLHLCHLSLLWLVLVPISQMEPKPKRGGRICLVAARASARCNNAPSLTLLFSHNNTQGRTGTMYMGVGEWVEAAAATRRIPYLGAISVFRHRWDSVQMGFCVLLVCDCFVFILVYLWMGCLRSCIQKEICECA